MIDKSVRFRLGMIEIGGPCVDNIYLYILFLVVFRLE